ncbi:MAG: carbohydrate binding family 9 domain-containing protein [Gemmatimonadota bacterium]|nr:MAG: carbohydrate binding family 9 domain-containing protein [Gemmatimonadota bacterium]
MGNSPRTAPHTRSNSWCAPPTTLALLLLSTLTPDPTWAQTPPRTAEAAELDTFVPNVQPVLQVERARGPIELDGALDDDGWVGAAQATNFAVFYPDEGERPPVESEVLVTYNDEYLFLGFIAYDDPSRIRASLRDRDEISNDDYFGILLDTYGDASWAYFLFANPLGVQADSRWSANAGEDFRFDIIFHSEAKITDDGYRVEMAIPFKSLRCPDHEVQEWRATFWRTRPRDSRAQHTWAGISRDDPCLACQFGTLAGIQGVKPGGALELMPALIASQAGQIEDTEDPSSGFNNHDPAGELSLFARYPFSSGITTELALNPDFSQVESDVAQIDVNTTFALFFPERRPFFQKGSDLFQSYFQVLYTRQINDPLVTGKLIGRTGRTTLAYLGGLDENSPILLPFQERSYVGMAERSLSNVGRFQQTFWRDSYVGAILTDRRLEDNSGSGTTGGIDGRLRFLENYSLEYQALASYTREPEDTTLTEGIGDVGFGKQGYTGAYDGESYWGHAWYVSVERNARTWFFDFDLWNSSPTFRADLGFENRNDFHRFTMIQGLQSFPDSRLIHRLQPVLFAQRIWNWDWLIKDDVLAANLQITWLGETFTVFEYALARERFRGVEFEGQRSWTIIAESGFSEIVRPGLLVRHGDRIARFTDPPAPGVGTDVEAWFELKPLTQWVIQPSLQYSELHDRDSGEEYFSGYILRARTVFQFTREFFVRLVVQYDDFNKALSFEPLITYRLNPFSMFYIGSTHGYVDYSEPSGFTQTERQFFAKFQYLFRI